MKRLVRRLPIAAVHCQSGAATLAVVMVLFFVVSLVAAYAGRNIIFEQRTSTNQAQGTVAFEAAEAGLEWAMSMLNSPRITDACLPSVSPADQTFRERYLDIDAITGNITPKASALPRGKRAACSIDGTSISCTCVASDADPVLPSATSGLLPTFVVRFVTLANPAPTRPGIVRVEVKGCTRPDTACLTTFPAPNPAVCQGTVCAMAALTPGLKSPPVAAITARGSVDGTTALEVYNTVFNPTTRSEGITIHAGTATSPVPPAPPAWALQGKPGTPADRTLFVPDPALADPAFTADRMFAASFGVWRETYWQQPGAVKLACAGGCNAAAVRSAATMNPGRVLLADGDVALDDGVDIGTLTDPIVLVVKGNLTFSGGTTLYGFVYAETANWAGSGAGTIRGAAVAENNLSGGGGFKVVYEPTVLDSLYRRTGSFVRAPASWRDFN